MPQRCWKSLRLHVPLAAFAKLFLDTRSLEEGTKPHSGFSCCLSPVQLWPSQNKKFSVFRAAEYLTSSWQREEEESSEKMSARATSL